jgi:hypothetical protein
VKVHYIIVVRKVVNTTLYLMGTAGVYGPMTTRKNNRKDVDSVFAILSHFRRRHIIGSLLASEEPMTLAELAGEVVGRENDIPLDENSAEEIQHVQISLYHTHVPKLVDEQLVHYDHDTGFITLSDCHEHLNQYEEIFSPTNHDTN